MHSLTHYDTLYNPDGTCLRDGQDNIIYRVECICGQASLATSECVTLWYNLHIHKPEIF